MNNTVERILRAEVEKDIRHEAALIEEEEELKKIFQRLCGAERSFPIHFILMFL